MTTFEGVWGELTDNYTTAMRAAGRSGGTIRLHRYYLGVLARTNPDPWTVTTDDLRRALSPGHWKPETRKSARSVYRSFYRWAHLEGLIVDDPSARLDSVRVPQAVPRPTPEAVIAEAMRQSPPRVQLMIQLAAYAGLRCSEICKVHERDLVDDDLMVSGKGGKLRSVPVMPVLRNQLERVSGWAFPNGQGSHLSPGHVTRLLSRALPGDWTGHTLRHRMASAAYAGTRDILAVGAVLGHSRPETTQRYVRMPDDALRAAVRAAQVA